MSTAVSENIKTRVYIADYLFFLRPMLHLPVWTIAILGFFQISHSYSSRLGLLLLTSSAAASWAYILNQLSDIESDRLNRKLFFLPDNIISPLAARILAAAMFLLTMAGGFSLGSNIAVLFMIGLLLGCAYSIKPLSWKARPMAGFLTNAVAHGVLPFAAGYIAAGGEPLTGFLRSIPYFLAVGGVFIGTTIPDYDGDRISGKITPAVRLGPDRAAVLMTFCTISSIISAWLLHDMALTIAGSLALPFYFLNWAKTSARNSALAAKVSILFLTLAAGWYFRAYLLIILILILITRIYYKWRFKMTYPTLA